MQHMAVQRVMLNLLYQREAFALIHGEVHQDVFRMRRVDQITQFARGNFQALGFGLATVDHRRDAAGFTELLGTSATTERAWKRVQGNRFHFSFVRRRLFQLSTLNSNNELTDELLWIA
jgi:hypothetical protein